MLKEAIEKIVDLATVQTYSIDGETYSEKPLHHIPRYYDKPESFGLSGLDGIVKMVRAEIDRLNAPLIIRISSPDKVDVFTTYGPDMSRNAVYTASAQTAGFRDGYTDHMETIIRLRSRFCPNEGQSYLLQLLSSINMDQSAQSTDNGVTQTITAKKGIALSQTVTVKPIIKLRPYRTFHEVEQPESEFLLRIDQDGRVGLFEADGGAWKLNAKENVMNYFEAALEDLIEAGKVVVAM